MATRFPLQTLVIHCSATPNGRWVGASEIDRWHAGRGFHRSAEAVGRFNPRLRAIGYHFLIEPNGALVSGRSPEEIGAHVAGHNAHSLGLCLIGTDCYTTAQWIALADEVRFLCVRYAVPRQFAHPGNAYRGVCGHRDLSPDLNGDGTIQPREWLKTCPGFSVAEWLAGGLEAPTEHVLPDAAAGVA